MANADPSAQPRRRRGKSTALAAQQPASLVAAIDHERIQLMQIHAMLKCLSEVLLYADDDDSMMHADVANVTARLLDESVVRLEAIRNRYKQSDADGNEAGAQQPDASAVPPRHHQVRESRPAYLC